MIPSTKELIAKYSTARVLRPSKKQFVMINGFSRVMTDADALEAMIRKYAK